MSDAVTSQWVRSAADERAVASGCYFDRGAAERVRRFFAGFLRHSKGQFAARPFELLDWQWLDIIAPAFGWRRADGTRRYRRVSLWVPKKNGKSTLAAGLILYGLVADNEPGAEVYGAAADRSQAGIIFGEVEAMVSQSPDLASRLAVNRSVRRVSYPAKHSFYQVLSKDSRKTGHGVNAHLCVIDELHVVNRELYDTLRYAGAARRQPLMVEISTAGNDKTSLGYERYAYCKRLLKEEQEDGETLAVVYEAESNEKWDQPDQWQQANPSLGTTISMDSFRGDFVEAKNGSPSTQSAFKQLRLNLWQDAVFAWLALELWDACAADITPDLLEGKPCWGGLDLASKLDLTAWVMIFELAEGVYAILCRFWVPEAADSRRARENKARLAAWIEAGYITATPGNVTDYNTIKAQVAADCERFGVKEVAFDPWNATQIATDLQDHGVKMVEFNQNIRSYNEPTREFERLVVSGNLKHDGNPVMRWMVAHTSARKDSSGNVRPDKERSGDHIDGVTGAIMALARAIFREDQPESVYDTTPLEIL